MPKTATRSTPAATTTRKKTPPPPPTIDPKFGLPVHPAAALLPLISDDELKALADDIKDHGLREPIVMLDGMILDGRNRLLACRKAGTSPEFTDWTPSDINDSPSTFVMSRNLHRRHLTASQRATAAVRLAEQMAAERRSERKEAHAEKRAPRVAFSSGRVRDRAAEIAGVSTGYVADAANLRRAAPDLFEQVAVGEMGLGAAQEQHVREAIKEGTLDKSPLRPAVKAAVQAKIEKKESPQKLRKFSKVASSRVDITLTVSFATRQAAEEHLTRMEEDPRVLEMRFDKA